MDNSAESDGIKKEPVYQITWKIEGGKSGLALKNLVEYAKNLPDNFLAPDQRYDEGHRQLFNFIQYLREFLETLEVKRIDGKGEICQDF